MPTGKLVVQRTSPQDIQIRDLYVQIDNQPEFNFNYNQTKHFDLEPGEHTIRATNRLFTKKDTFQIKENETVVYEASNEASGCISTFIWGLGMPYYLLKLTRIQSL